MAGTFHASATKEWTLIVDGAAYSRVGIQHNSRHFVEVYVGSVVPAADTEDFVAIGPNHTREIVIGLTSLEKVYVRCSNAADATIAVALRGFREVRT